MAITIGCNYKADSPNWAADAAYLKSVGVVNVRPNLSSLPTPWVVGATTSGGYAFWRNCAAYFASQGFWVSWGPASLNGVTTGTFTATQWTQYHDSVVLDATYLQTNGIALGAYELGNEMESQADGSTLTVDQMITNIKQLATDVKAVYKLSPITYSLWDFNGTTYDKWITAGLGGLDMLGLHPYGNLQNSGRDVSLGGYTALKKMMLAFGPSKLYISEYGIDATDANLNSMTTAVKVATMRNFFSILTNLGFTRSMVYSFVGYLNGDNQFAMKKTDGTYIAEWDIIQNFGKRAQNITL